MLAPGRPFVLTELHWGPRRTPAHLLYAGLQSDMQVVHPCQLHCLVNALGCQRVSSENSVRVPGKQHRRLSPPPKSARQVLELTRPQSAYPDQPAAFRFLGAGGQPGFLLLGPCHNHPAHSRSHFSRAAPGPLRLPAQSERSRSRLRFSRLVEKSAPLRTPTGRTDGAGAQRDGRALSPAQPGCAPDGCRGRRRLRGQGAQTQGPVGPQGARGAPGTHWVLRTSALAMALMKGTTLPCWRKSRTSGTAASCFSRQTSPRMWAADAETGCDRPG